MTTDREKFLHTAQAALAAHFAAVSRLRGYRHYAQDVVGLSFGIICLADSIDSEPRLHKALESLSRQLQDRYDAALKEARTAPKAEANTVPKVKPAAKSGRRPWLDLPRGWLG